MGSKAKSLKGQLLLDGGKLRGSFFHRAVVLICQHDQDGAFGLVLTKPSGKTLGKVVEMTMPAKLKKLPLFLGGPVQPTVLSYLHTSRSLVTGNVIPKVSLGHSIEDLVEMGEDPAVAQQVRIFGGYAGWSPGQLDDEMRREAWLTHPATRETVFDTDPAVLWKTVLRSKGWEYRLLADSPEDLTWN